MTMPNDLNHILSKTINKLGSHPLATGVGAAGGAAMGAGAGLAASPLGAAVGIVVGAVVGGLAGKEAAAMLNPTEEDRYWNEAVSSAPYYLDGYTYDDDAPAYCAGYTNHHLKDHASVLSCK